MKYILILSIWSFISCNKSDSGPAKQINDNKLTAQVTVLDRMERSFTSSGYDSTGFFKRLDSLPDRVDSVITVFGFDGIGTLGLTLYNISSPGTYQFLPADTSGNNVSVSFYSEGGYSPTLLASSAGTDTAGNPYASGSFTIIKLNNSEIEGTFNTIMKNVEQEVIIKNGYFKGQFQK